MPESNARLYGHLAFGPGAELPSEFRTEDDGRCGDVGGAWRYYHNGLNTRPDLDGSHPAGTAADFAGEVDVPAVQPAVPECAVMDQPEKLLQVNGQVVTGQGDVGPVQLALVVDDIEGEVDMPITGTVIDFAGAYVPAGWLDCDGSAVSRTTYADLFAIIGTTWGPGDGVSTFNLPNGRGRVVLGAGDDGDGHVYAVGDYGGANSTTLISDNLPGYLLDVLDAGHFHGVTDPGHGHAVTDPGHVHTPTDPGHVHGVTDPGHVHNINFSLPGGSSTTGTKTIATTNRPGLDQTQSAITGLTVNSNTTGLTIGSATTGLTVDDDTTGLTINVASTGIEVHSKGMSVPIDRRMPYLVMRRLIKT